MTEPLSGTIGNDDDTQTRDREHDTISTSIGDVFQIFNMTDGVFAVVTEILSH